MRSIDPLSHACAALVVLLGTAGCSSSDRDTSSTTSQSASASSGSGGAEERPFRVAISVSPFTETLFESGAHFSDGKSVATDTSSLEAMFVAHGANEVFARISTEKNRTTAVDDHSEENALARAQLAKSMGLPFNPELGLWAHYGDISCEPAPDFTAFPEISVPGAWSTLTIDQMAPVIESYAALVAAQILQTGVTVDVWDIGNEVDLGTAGVAPRGFNCSTPYTAPDGVDPAIGSMTVINLLMMAEPDRIQWLTDHVWPHEARLFAAAVAGIRSVDPHARFATHMSQSLSPTFALAFYQAMADGGFTPHEMGFSYYPSATGADGRVASFRDTVTQVEEHFQRPVFIAEFAYPAGPTTGGSYDTWNNAVPNYPIGDDGQAAFLKDMASWAKASGLSGIRPWAPDVFVQGWQGFALFEAPPSGNTVMARPALQSIADGIAAPDANAFHD